MVKSEYMMEEELSVSDENKSNNELELLDDEAYGSEWPLPNGDSQQQQALQQRRRSCGELLLIQSTPSGNGNGGGHVESGALSSCTSSTSSSGNESSSMLLMSPHQMTRSAGASNVVVGVEDKRLRRQIANCNERRRMQSINAGFGSLRQLLPRKGDGDKMSKASILQQTGDYIRMLLMEKERLEQENDALLTRSKRRRLDESNQNNDNNSSMDTGESHHPHPHHIPSSGAAPQLEALRTIEDLRSSLVREQQLRLAYERELMEMQGRTHHQQHSAFSQLSPQQAHLDGGFELIGASAGELAGYTPSNVAAGLVLAAGQQAQPPSILGSALSSAISTLRGVLGSRIIGPAPGGDDVKLDHTTAGATAMALGQTHAHPHPLPAPIPSTSVGGTAALGGSESSISQRNLQAILDAIRHIEGGAFAATNG